MNTLARWARAEWGLLCVTVREPLLKRRWRAIPMTIGAVCLTGALQYVQNRSWGYQFVQDVGAVRAEDPFWPALLRTPLSLFVPALDLPVWGALAQILFVFGIAEICLGRWRTLVIAYAATLAGTLFARLGIWLGFDNPFGLPGSDAWVVDTGPSAAVVGLAVFVAWRYGAYVTALAVTAAMAIEVLLKGNLAGKEHLAAIIAVGLLCLTSALRHRRRGAGTGSGAGKRNESGSGSGSGSGKQSGSGAERGPGTGPGSGARQRSGPGSGTGPSTGPDQGPRPRTGSGPGEDTGPEPGAKPGPDTRPGPGTGPEPDAMPGPAAGPESDRRPGSGTVPGPGPGARLGLPPARF